MVLKLKELVFIGNSLCPAEIVGFPEDHLVEVQWLESGAGANWEVIYPLSSVKSMQSRRTRTRAMNFTGGDDKKSSQAKRATAAARRNTTDNPRRSTKRNAAAKPYQPRKVTIKQQQSVKRSKPSPKKPPPKKQPFKRNANVTLKHDGEPYPPKRRRMVARMTTGTAKTVSSFGQSVARMPLRNDDSSSSSSSDEELLEQARRQRTKRTVSQNDDRKPAAKQIIRLDFSDDSSDDDELLKPAAKSEKSSSMDSASSDDDVDSSDDDVDFATTRAASKNRTGPKPGAKRRNKRRGGRNESASDQNASPKTPHHAKVKQEHVAPLIRDTFQVNDHVWVRDGNKNEQHPAIVTKVLGDDFLEIQWDGYKVKKKVPKSVVSLMFDLTTNNANNQGRPRRSTRARHEPERHGANPVKKEKEFRKRSTKAKKPSNSKNVARRQKSRKKVIAIDSSDSDTDTEPAVERSAGTNIGDPISLLDSSDGESDSGLSVLSVATFEYTAPGVDTRFRSLHNITDLNDFIRVKSWKQKEAPQNDNADMQTVIEGNREGTPDEERQMDTSPDVAREDTGTTSTNGIQVARAQYSPSSTDCPRLSLDGEHFVFDKVCGTAGREPLPNAGIQARAVSLDEPVPDSRRDSNETANPDDLPDILLPIESEDTVNEDRLTADTQELSQAFAAFGDCDFE